MTEAALRKVSMVAIVTSKSLTKHGHALAEVDDEHRYQVRKEAKKLRYAAEFFASLFDDTHGVRRHTRFISSMEELQGSPLFLLGCFPRELSTVSHTLYSHSIVPGGFEVTS